MASIINVTQTFRGSAAQVKFFPIFFLQDVGLRPSALNLLLAGTPLALAAASFLAQAASFRLGALSMNISR